LTRLGYETLQSAEVRLLRVRAGDGDWLCDATRGGDRLSGGTRPLEQVGHDNGVLRVSDVEPVWKVHGEAVCWRGRVIEEHPPCEDNRSFVPIIVRENLDRVVEESRGVPLLDRAGQVGNDRDWITTGQSSRRDLEGSEASRLRAVLRISESHEAHERNKFERKVGEVHYCRS